MNHYFVGIGTTLLAFIFLIAAYPLKNFLEIRRNKKEEKYWNNWVQELPLKEEFMKKSISIQRADPV